MCQAWESYKEELADQGVSDDQFNRLLEDGSGPTHILTMIVGKTKRKLHSLIYMEN